MNIIRFFEENSKLIIVTKYILNKYNLHIIGVGN